MRMKNVLRGLLIALLGAALVGLCIALLGMGFLLEAFANADTPQGAAPVRTWDLWLRLGGHGLGLTVIAGCLTGCIIRWWQRDLRRSKGTLTALWQRRSRAWYTGLMGISALAALLMGLDFVQGNGPAALLPGAALAAGTFLIGKYTRDSATGDEAPV